MNRERKNQQSRVGCEGSNTSTNSKRKDDSMPFARTGTACARCTPPAKGTIDISKLRAFASNLPDCSLREVLITEASDEIEIPIFLARLPIWLRLSKSLGR